MAIIKCPKCNAIVSDKATKCTKCSYEFKSNQTQNVRTLSTASKSTEKSTQKPKPKSPILGGIERDYRNVAIICAIAALALVIVVVVLIVRNNNDADEPVAIAVAAIEQNESEYPYTSERIISEEELYGMTSQELKIMRNEIFARHGYIFSSPDLIEHFSTKTWYSPETTDVTLSDIESKNVDIIKHYEQRLASFNASAKSAGIYPFTSKRKIKHKDVKSLSSVELKIMRNEIYARHGYIFKQADMAMYFANQNWYCPITHDVELSDVESYNVAFIKQYE